MRKLGGILTATVVAVLLSGLAPEPSGAAPKHAGVRTRAFDGLWSVSIFTREGPCSASYRYPARIVGGQVVQAENSFSYQISGVVIASGGISVTVSSGGQSATGYGRLTHSKGSGWWRAAGGQCSGVWSAMRRG
jgi:hypothetical protein